MALNWKRLGALAGFLLLSFIIGYGIYLMFLRPQIPPEVTPPVVNAPGAGLPQAGVNTTIPVAPGSAGVLPAPTNGNVAPPPTLEQPTAPAPAPVASDGPTQTTALTEQPALGATLNANGQEVLYYSRSDGRFYRLGSDGQPQLLTDEIFFSVDTVTWAPNRTSAILEYPDGANILYNFSTKKQVTLPQHWTDFSFSPASSEIVFKSLGSSEESRWLVIANSDGSQAQQVEHLGNNDATVYPAWSPNNQIIATHSRSVDLDRQNLIFIGRNHENFPLTVIEGRDFRGQWSPQGDQLLYSVYSSSSGYRPTLWIVSGAGSQLGQNRRDLQLQTWADKCSFAGSTTIYCAVPRSLAEGAGIFAADLDTAPTDIYRIDLTTGFKNLIAQPLGDPNISQLMVTSDGRYLNYLSKDDGRLYQIRLK